MGRGHGQIQILYRFGSARGRVLTSLRLKYKVCVKRTNGLWNGVVKWWHTISTTCIGDGRGRVETGDKIRDVDKKR